MTTDLMSAVEKAALLRAVRSKKLELIEEIVLLETRISQGAKGQHLKLAQLQLENLHLANAIKKIWGFETDTDPANNSYTELQYREY
jgi:hypothetical protein